MRSWQMPTGVEEGTGSLWDGHWKREESEAGSMELCGWSGAELVRKNIIPRVPWLVWPLGWALPGHMGQCMRKIPVLIGSLACLVLCDECPLHVLCPKG
jgi:hypothetical protein